MELQNEFTMNFVKLKTKENLDPTKDPESHGEFLSKFKWDKSILSQLEKTELEKLLIEPTTYFHDIDGNSGVQNQTEC